VLSAPLAAFGRFPSRVRAAPENLLVATNEHDVKRQSRVIGQVFKAEHMEVMVKTVNGLAQSFLVKKLQDSQGNHLPFYAYSTFVEYIRSSLGVLTYGFSPNAAKVISAQRHFAEADSSSFIRFLFPRISNLAPHLSGLAQTREAMKALDTLVSEPDEGSLLALLLDVSSQDQEALTRAEIRSNTIAFGVAGIDSTASALSSLVYVLTKYPDVQGKVREEINKVLEQREPTYSNLKRLKYLKAVIKETLRMFPPFPILFPRVSRKGEDIGGFHVPARTNIVLSVVGINRHPDNWINPDTFDPSRFLPSSEQPHEKDSLSLLTWGAGARACVGKRLAKLFIRSTIVALLRKTELTSCNVEEVHIVRALGTVRPKPNLHIVPRPVSNGFQAR